jgi:nanoRNase/pAp phosphatase (c-di-AMP/oligoRNAs hydrolase)
VHDNPDPDAMAGAMCLAHFVEEAASVRPRIVYGGIIGRAENRNMVRALEIPLWTIESVTFQPDDAVLMVDTQPGFANNSLPEGQEVLAVFDHHSADKLPDIPHVDVRPEYGAVATMMVEYLAAAHLEVTPRLATAVCYGISTETQDLGREASGADIAAFVSAFPISDQPLLGRLRHPRRSISFFAGLAQAIRAARVAGNVVVCHLESLYAPDAAAEMADMLVGAEGIRWVMCTGVFGGKLLVSVRTTDRLAEAGELLRDIAGERNRAGGHGMVAGGSFRLDGGDPAELHTELAERFLKALGSSTTGLKPFLALRGIPADAPVNADTGDNADGSSSHT